MVLYDALDLSGSAHSVTITTSSLKEKGIRKHYFCTACICVLSDSSALMVMV